MGGNPARRLTAFPQLLEPHKMNRQRSSNREATNQIVTITHRYEIICAP